VKGNADVLGRISPTAHKDVTLQIASELAYDVQFRCPLSVAGEEFEFDLTARDAAGELDNVTATTTVVCGETPLTPDLVLPIVVGLVAVPPPPPPPPVNVSSASQAQSQAQAQAGAAFQEEKQPQVAVAAAYKEMLEQRAAMEYEMVAYDNKSEPVSPLFVLGAGFVLAACAYGFSLARERVAVSHQRR
jgi:hypothetical protein